MAALPFSIMSWLKKHSLSLVVALMFLVFIGSTLILGPHQFREERQLPADTPISQEYWEWWGYNTILSLEADIFGAFLLIVLTKYLREQGSAEDRESK